MGEALALVSLGLALGSVMDAHQATSLHATKNLSSFNCRGLNSFVIRQFDFTLPVLLRTLSAPVTTNSTYTLCLDNPAVLH
jgi:hypothetical protein